LAGGKLKKNLRERSRFESMAARTPSKERGLTYKGGTQKSAKRRK